MAGKSILNKIARLENMHRGNNAPRAAWALILRYYQHYRLTGDRQSLERAAHLCQTYFAINYHFIWAYFLNIYMELEQGHTPKAQIMLEKLKPFRGDMKMRPMAYAAYLFLYAATDLKRGKARGARKSVSLLTSLASNLHDPRIYALLGGYHILSHEREPALKYLLAALNGGGMFLYIFAHDFFMKERFEGEESSALLAAYARFALAHGMNNDLSVAAGRNRQAVLMFAQKDRALGYAVYDALEPDWLLEGLVNRQINDRENSKIALKYYIAAEQRQISVPGLAEALVTAARVNEHFDISRYTLERYFKESDGEDLKTGMFAYYIIEGFGGIVPGPGAVRFLLRMLEVGASSPYMPALCMLLLRGLDDKDGRYAAYTGKASQIVKEAVFLHDVKVENPAARYIWVFEDEKAFSKIYELNSGRTVVSAVKPDFTYILFDDSMKNIIGGNVSVQCKVGGMPDSGFLSKLYESGFAPPELLIALSKHYIEKNGVDAGGLELLHKTAGHKDISARFKARVRAALGSYHASGGNYAEAVKYYEATPPGFLDAAGVERMLLAYVNGGMLKHAADILAKRPVISDKALFYCVRKLTADKKLHKDVAAAAYELVQKSWYDKSLVTISLEHAHASQREWQEFSRTLISLNAPSEILDENIINNAIWTRRFDPGAQKVFAAFFSRSPQNPYIMAFALYAAFEAIINHAKPEYETIEVLEKLALGPMPEDAGGAADIRFIHYALCHIYLGHGITTFSSGEILRQAIAFCETDGIIFPVFKEIKDKSLLTPYIEKNQTFIYRGGKGKRVKLLYKPANASEFAQKSMRYIRFGLYAAGIPVFYGEKLNYAVSEESATGSIMTKEAETQNSVMRIVENTGDMYYVINNAIIYESMFKYEAVEEIINGHLKEVPRVKAWLM
ncbi:MAG: DUF5717 family protein [Defluviitaleaceae bacterium]|nr:DUF5717 family protein [Defluviitaleaceae bacterium]MCL2836295.1 DUF5717 family protein [Defluviitaleaceae bacterium]